MKKFSTTLVVKKEGGVEKKWEKIIQECFVDDLGRQTTQSNMLKLV